MPEKSKNASYIKHPRQVHTHTQTYTHIHSPRQARDLPQTHVLSVTASDSHPSTQGMGCPLIVKHPELDESCNKFFWKRRGREKAKDSKDELEISSLWPAQEFPKSTGQLTANLWAKGPALFHSGSCILAFKKERDPPSIWGKKTKAQAHKSHLSV